MWKERNKLINKRNKAPLDPQYILMLDSNWDTEYCHGASFPALSSQWIILDNCVAETKFGAITTSEIRGNMIFKMWFQSIFIFC